MVNETVRIEYYVSESGKFPFHEWLSSLKDRKGKGVVVSRLNRIRVGNYGDFKWVGKGVYELRIKYGPGYRVYFSKESENIVIVLCGGDKGGQKKDIDKAQKLLADYRGER